MPASSNLRAAARLAVTLALVAMCAGADAGVAQPAPPVQLAPLNPGDFGITPTPAPNSRELFGLSASADNFYSARWRDLQSLLRIKTQIVTLCRINPGGCPATAAKFISIVDVAGATAAPGSARSIAPSIWRSAR
jgi:hypothetical protein